jgi:para-nitrobenzyl esterase
MMAKPADMIEISTTEGPVRGRIEDGLVVFRGVPFAQPPVEYLRFTPPVPPAARFEALDATAPAAICPQLPSRISVAMGAQGGRQDEDCLTLTVWSPLPLGRSRPMLVWIHGGAFLSGGGSLAWYDGARLARDNDIVVVGVNYRLGAFGFLCRPGLVNGNMGFLDQMRALEWLAENAANLGGDPQQVTLMGQSVGAISIACMLALPEARRRFRRAIFLSGGLLATLPAPVAEASAAADKFCASLGVDPNGPDALKRLQRIPVARILEAQLAVIRNTARPEGDPVPALTLTAVQGLPAGSALELAVREGAREIDALVGSTAEEMRIFQGLDPRISDLKPEDLPKVGQGLFGDSSAARFESVRRARPGTTPTRMMTDACTEWFVQGCRRIAVGVAEAKRRAWLLRFDWSAPESGYGACHCIDLPFVFGNFDAFKGARMLAGADRADMEALSGIIRSAVGRFVREGSPAGDNLPDWPPFTRSQPVMMVFNSILQHGWVDWRSI